MHVYDVLKRPIVTEKTGAQAEARQYTFEVDPRANKIQVKDAVETAFNVTVTDVRMVHIPAKHGRYGRATVVKKPAIKKAVVTLAPGNSIQLFEGV
ncbi:MAG: 50S ribosomal protein L23 [Anaerolineae bacterium]|jgi:large subunit ribosomal protein L23|nr:50S ribosomal protein L23 [Anaerolineae bacterium]